MKELSLNILDVTENSVKAEATLVTIEIYECERSLKISIADDGYGMSEEILKGNVVAGANIFVDADADKLKIEYIKDTK